MKKPYYLLLLLFAALFSACDKDDTQEPIDKLFSFDIKNEKPFKIKKEDVNAAYTVQQLGITMPLPVSGVASNAEAGFRDNNTTTSLVTAITLQEMILTMPDNATEDFSFLEKMDVYIATDSTGSDAVLMAHNRNIPTNVGRKLVFTPTTNSMEKFVKAGKYALILKDAYLRRTVTADLDITARITYRVTANPLE